jgi:leukotriene-A4 hydrolase
MTEVPVKTPHLKQKWNPMRSGWQHPMLQRRLLLTLTTLLFLTAARHRGVLHRDTPRGAPPPDPFSSSQPLDVTTRHLALDLTVDLANQQLHGSATLDIENLTGTRTLVLDTHALTIHSVKLNGQAAAEWSVDTASGALRIAIDPLTTNSVTVSYTTAKRPTAMFWRSDMVYSINSPNAARSWMPVQDTPSVRMTYDATIRGLAPGYIAVMSALGNPRAANATGVYTLHMPIPVPAYLIALGAGAIEYHAFDERTGFYGQSSVMAEGRTKLQTLPEIVAAAERILGPLPWPRHDILFMPGRPSLLGMEHPMLNFLSTQSGLADPPGEIVVHELAHAWAGNTATYANWNDAWISEGIATYLTARIMEELLGPNHAAGMWARDRAILDDVFEKASARDTILHVGVDDPFEGFTRVTYLKGGLFLKMLEDKLGRPALDAFLRTYFETYRYRWVDDTNFLSLLRRTALAGRPGLESELMLQEWLYEPFFPSNVTVPGLLGAQTRSIFDHAPAPASAHPDHGFVPRRGEATLGTSPGGLAVGHAARGHLELRPAL